MTYVPGKPLTGFTLELDGEIGPVERVAKAVMKAINDEIKLAQEEAEKIWLRDHSIVETMVYVRPLVPFQGTIQLRTTA